MTTLLDYLTTKLSSVFAGQGLDPKFGTVRVSDRPDLAPFQCNGAMGAAKQAGKNPRDVAAHIVTALKTDPDFVAEKLEIAGPGFINLHIKDNVIQRFLTNQVNDAHHGITQDGAGQTVMLDYGGPNAAKAMHVGHLRTAIVGDTLRRILRAAGYNALGDIHLGDDGLQAGMVISELEIRYPEWPYFMPAKTDGFPTDFPLNFDDLTEIYPAASTAAKADTARMERAKQATFNLQQGHAGYNALWANIVAMSCASMARNYGALNVHFDLWKGENCVSPLIPGMVEDLRARQFAVESDGAWVIPVARNDDKKEFPPLILIKSDGAYLYATTDLATLIDRMSAKDHPKLDWVIYVVDQRQGLHFEQVFRAARMTGIVPETLRLDFAGIGTMNGPDGKPFKTRAGGVLRLQDLIQMAVDKALERMSEAHVADDMSDDERRSIALMVAVSAIKFADLKNPRHVDYMFDLNAMTSFEGKTGPYLLYQAVRMQSILAKAKDAGFAPKDRIVDDTTRTLSLLLLDYPNMIEQTIQNLSVHILADYLHRLAQEFSGFYNAHHILSETDAARRDAWLQLVADCHATLTHGLGLMGINVPERM
jgi:arginyl-tRNA synthetase